jgi:hypothetical protein
MYSHVLVPLDGFVLRGADATSELARLDREDPQSLLCLTTLARRPLGPLLFGSVAGELVRQLTDRPLRVEPAAWAFSRAAL